MKQFVLLNVFDSRRHERRRYLPHDSWMEKLIFYKGNDNTVEFFFQGGYGMCYSHSGGGSWTETLPGEWFSKDWEYFVDCFMAKYPERHFGIGREELLGNSSLREFMGFE